MFRTAIGFDRLARLVDTAASSAEASGYPPYNIEKLGEENLRLGGVFTRNLKPEVLMKSLRTAMQLDKTLYDGQAESEPAGLAVAVRLGAAEPAEDAVELGGRHPAARIGHGQDHVPALETDADLDQVARLGMSDGVLQ